MIAFSSRLQALSYGFKTFFKSIPTIFCNSQLLLLYILYSATGVAIAALSATLKTYAITNPVFMLSMLAVCIFVGGTVALVLALSIAHKASSLMKSKQSSLLTSLKTGIYCLPKMILLLCILMTIAALLGALSICALGLMRTLIALAIIKVGKLPLIILSSTLLILFIITLSSLTFFIISAVGVSKCSLKDAVKTLKTTPYLLSQIIGAATPVVLFIMVSNVILFRLGLLTNQCNTLYISPATDFLATVNIIACTVIYHRAKGLPTNKHCNRA
ncbi:hypothetical protein HOL34_00350 [bacterium]|jgi:hypothetical protein|nr:hypothetical protein [bacterium]MBT3903341.1 hypothetical protein [bacterium]MBT4578157.1 hypothetical protein [bacterium]MBT5345501.1 hypothetical protein [bacterium]MBT6131195.1 hypothetical protein [bacterium]